MIEDYYNDNPDGDFFEDGMTDEVIEKFIVYINKIDENVLEDNTFWNLVIEECRELQMHLMRTSFIICNFFGGTVKGKTL